MDFLVYLDNNLKCKQLWIQNNLLHFSNNGHPVYTYFTKYHILLHFYPYENNNKKMS